MKGNKSKSPGRWLRRFAFITFILSKYYRFSKTHNFCRGEGKTPSFPCLPTGRFPANSFLKCSLISQMVQILSCAFVSLWQITTHPRHDPAQCQFYLPEAHVCRLQTQ